MDKPGIIKKEKRAQLAFEFRPLPLESDLLFWDKDISRTGILVYLWLLRQRDTYNGSIVTRKCQLSQIVNDFQREGKSLALNTVRNALRELRNAGMIETVESKQEKNQGEHWLIFRLLIHTSQQDEYGERTWALGTCPETGQGVRKPDSGCPETGQGVRKPDSGCPETGQRVSGNRTVGVRKPDRQPASKPESTPVPATPLDSSLDSSLDSLLEAGAQAIKSGWAKRYSVKKEREIFLKQKKDEWFMSALKKSLDLLECTDVNLVRDAWLKAIRTHQTLQTYTGQDIRGPDYFLTEEGFSFLDHAFNFVKASPGKSKEADDLEPWERTRANFTPEQREWAKTYGRTPGQYPPDAPRLPREETKKLLRSVGVPLKDREATEV